jgi:arsenate reductase
VLRPVLLRLSGWVASGVKTYLFACVHNAGRSQMAAAFFNAIADPAKGRAISAGTRPADAVHPEVVEVMREVGVDLENVTPQGITDALTHAVQTVITMGCGEECPFIPGARVEDWPLEDPKGQPRDRVRGIRDEIRARVRDLIARERVGPCSPGATATDGEVDRARR